MTLKDFIANNEVDTGRLLVDVSVVEAAEKEVGVEFGGERWYNKMAKMGKKGSFFSVM